MTCYIFGNKVITALQCSYLLPCDVITVVGLQALFQLFFNILCVNNMLLYWNDNKFMYIYRSTSLEETCKT